MPSLDAALKLFFKALDRKDFAALAKMVDSKIEGIDEILKDWIRGKRAFDKYMKRMETEVSNITSKLTRVQTRRLGAVGLATFTVRQSYAFAGQKQNVKLATSMVFVKRGAGWKATVINMTPLA